MAVAVSPIILQLRVYVHLPLPHDGISCRCDLERQHTKLKYTISNNCFAEVYNLDRSKSHSVISLNEDHQQVELNRNLHILLM